MYKIKKNSMSKLSKIVSTIAITTAVVMVSCKSTHSDYEGYTKNENGLYYKLVNHDEKGEHPKEGDQMEISYCFKLTKNDSVYIESKKFSHEPEGKMKLPLFKSTYKGSLEEGIAMMAKGDSASFIIAADSFFLKAQNVKELPKFIKPGDKMTVNIKLFGFKAKEQVQKEQMAEMEQMASQEKVKVDAYLAQNKITAAPTASGIYIMTKEKGKGKGVKTGDMVQVHYKGMFLDGKVFDSSEGRPEPFSFQVGGRQVIQGWDEALLNMTVGTKATLLIPSNMAYGPQGNQGIPPFSPLLFEITVVGTKDAPKEPAQK